MFDDAEDEAGVLAKSIVDLALEEKILNNGNESDDIVNDNKVDDLRLSTAMTLSNGKPEGISPSKDDCLQLQKNGNTSNHLLRDDNETTHPSPPPPMHQDKDSPTRNQKTKKKQSREEKRMSRKNRKNKSKSPTRPIDEDDVAASTIKAQSAMELEELDDNATAWAERRDGGKTWGGRGHGGRGINTISSSVDNIHLQNVSLAFSGNELLQNATIQISKGKRYGLIGRNGTGKSTLLRRLANKSIPGFPLSIRVFLVQQQIDGDERSTLQTLLDADIDRRELIAERDYLEQQIDRPSVTSDEITEIV